MKIVGKTLTDKELTILVKKEVVDDVIDTIELKDCIIIREHPFNPPAIVEVIVKTKIGRGFNYKSVFFVCGYYCKNFSSSYCTFFRTYNEVGETPGFLFEKEEGLDNFKLRETK